MGFKFPFAESVIVNGKLDVSEIIKNEVAFIPYGVFVHILWEQKSFVTQCVPIFATSLLLEVLQFAFPKLQKSIGLDL